MARPALRTDLTEAERARLRARYPPPRVPRPLVVALVVVGAVGSLGWLVWSAIYHAEPPVKGMVTAYTVRSDTLIDVTLTVDRPDPSLTASCRVQAKAADFQVVGEAVVPVDAASYRVGDVPVKITTLRRAVSAEVAGCSIS